MRRASGMRGAAFALCAAALSVPTLVRGETKADDRIKDTAEFSYVVTAGNSETDTLGFKDKLWRKWERSSFEINAGGVRAESTTIVRTASGTQTDYTIRKDETTAVTAQNYFANGRYDRKITDRFFWFVGTGWDRNTFAGIQNRYTGVGGVGNTWIDAERVKFRTDYSVTYTNEKDVVDNPNFKANFSGLRVSSNFMHKIGATSAFNNDLVLDENLDDTSDFRANMISSLTATMNARLALKVSLQWLYDHQPAFVAVDLLNSAPPVKVLAQLDDLDTIFTASLVLNF